MTSQAHRADDFRPPAEAQPPVSIIDRLYAARDRLLGSPRFQRFSAVFPFTRPIARKQARALFDLCAGFVYSQVLSACIALDLFRRVTDAPKTAAQLARETSVPAERLERLLRAAVSLRLLSQRNGGRFGLGMLGAALAGNPGIAAMIEHHAMLYRDLADPVALLKGTSGETDLARYWRYAGSPEASALGSEQVAAYSALMAASQSFIADDVLAAYPFARHRCLLDVGGGEGAFISAAAAQCPDLRFMLFDLPAVAERAAAKLAARGIGGRVAVTGGSFRDDPLPHGADLISLVRVVHDHDDPVVLALLRAVHEALPPGGTVLIAEPMAGVAGDEAVADAYFGLYLLAMGSGRPRTPAEIGALLTVAGFQRPRPVKTRRPMLVGAMTAER